MHRALLPLAFSLALAMFAACAHPAGRPASSTVAPAPVAGATAVVAGRGAAPGPQTPPVTTPKSAVQAPKAIAATTALLPSRFTFVGRVLSVDEPAHTAIIELSPYAILPDDLGGLTLYTRDRDLRPVARLQATPNRRGVILGTRTLEGRPAVGDEVVQTAPTPPAPEALDASAAAQPGPTRR